MVIESLIAGEVNHSDSSMHLHDANIITDSCSQQYPQYYVCRLWGAICLKNPKTEI